MFSSRRWGQVWEKGVEIVVQIWRALRDAAVVLSAIIIDFPPPAFDFELKYDIVRREFACILTENGTNLFALQS
jgi:hypothetical protein